MKDLNFNNHCEALSIHQKVKRLTSQSLKEWFRYKEVIIIAEDCESVQIQKALNIIVSTLTFGVSFTKVALTGLLDGFTLLTEGVLIGLASTFGVPLTNVALIGFLAVFNMAILANSLPFAKVDFLDDDMLLNF